MYCLPGNRCEYSLSIHPKGNFVKYYYSSKHTRFSEETYDFFILTPYKIFAESWIHSQFIAKTLFSRYSVTTKAMIDVVCVTGRRIMVATVSHM